MHARLNGHSELEVHSGLQFGGSPFIPGTHEQAACLFTTWHTELSPHGEGLQGSVSSKIGSSGASMHLKNGSPVVNGGQLQIGE